MTKPTREEVFSAYDDLNNSIKTGYLLEKLDALKYAYLAQEEELKEKDRLMKSYVEMVHESNEQGFRELQRIGELKAENQALEEELKEIQRFVIHEHDGGPYD